MKTNFFSAIRNLFFTAVFFLPFLASSAAQEPNFPTFSISATAGACNEIELSFFPGDGSRRLIIACAGSPISEFPVDGTNYTGGSIFGTGTNLGNGNYVVYSGSGNNTTISGLDGGTEYYFASFEFNGVGNNSNYLITGYPEDNDIAPGISMTVLSSSGDICVGDSVQLQASGALTYLWSPSSGLSSATDPIVSAIPASTTTYTVTGTDAGGCQDSKTLTVIVNQLPLVTLGSFQSICINEGVFVLSGGNPVGGTYFGTGVSSGILDPTIPGPGGNDIFYTYTDIHGCIDTATRTIQIKNSPNVTLSAFAGVCIDEPAYGLTEGSPSGGDYTGTGVNANDIFNPANAGVGSHTITYIYSSLGCSDTATGTLTVHALPVVSFSTLPATCLNTPAYLLSGGSPSGGTYTGTAVSGNEFTPSTAGVGNFILTYGYTNSNGCSASDTSMVHVNGLPTVSFSTLPTVCQNTGPVALSQGSPAGGTYSGPGVGGTTFYTGIAGAGTHSLVYTYHDANNCSNTATQDIIVNPIPVVSLGADVTICSDASVVLNGGSFTTYAWSNGANTPSITIDSTGRGLGVFRFILIATNSFTCANRDTIFVTIDPCNSVKENDRISFAAFPNPFSSNIVVKMNSGFEIYVYDISGRLIIHEKDHFSEAQFGDDLSAGTYLLRVKTAQGEGSSIVVKE
ncbi:MAG TPA: T9SS type A sorting domain-containing protein [Bacteroidia bacterium]|nr:T9SS type A sorting domain-containing protein [Bacteroidia bacterium]